MSSEAIDKSLNQACMNLNEPWIKPWDEIDLEWISKCPVCNSQKRQLMHGGLVDNVFRVAPGYWDLYECLGCTSAYLDPRPSESSIGQAYKSYYTHNAAEERVGSNEIGLPRLLRRALANGYLNKRYGTHYQPSWLIGLLFAFIFRRQRETLDTQFRWLPKPSQGQRLLDIGCGNGGFLLKARDAGWQVVGVDIDPNAVITARKLGLEVYEGTVDMLPDEIGAFDAVTLNHVIEHVHDPRKLLHSIYQMLNPNGILYIATPNIRSIGAKIFKKNWRGMESPRHLVLFTANSLIGLVKECGFINIELKVRRNITKAMYMTSYGLEKNLTFSTPHSIQLPLTLKLLSNFPFIPLSYLEFITITVRRES